MGMRATYRRLSTVEFQSLCADSALADTYFGWDIDDDDDDGLDAYIARYENESNSRYLDIQKAFHGLYFLLTGDADMKPEVISTPLGKAVEGGTNTEWEATYGMVRYLTPQEVNEVDTALKQISEAEFRNRYTPEAFQIAAIYPGGIWTTNSINELLAVFRKVRGFFAEAARAGEVVLLSCD
jgi:hypothetical protein